MKKIRIEIIADNKIGLKKGDVKTLSPSIANRLIKNKQAKFIEEVDYAPNTEPKADSIVELINDTLAKLGEANTEIQTLKDELVKTNDTLAKLGEDFKKLTPKTK